MVKEALVETEVTKAMTQTNKMEDVGAAQHSDELVNPKADFIQQTFMCEVCDKMGLEKGKMKEHRSTHVRGEQCKCADCAQILLIKKKLTTHEVDEHGAETQGSPSRSNEGARNEKQKVESLEISELENSIYHIGNYTCHVCNEEVQTTHESNRHSRNMHVDSPNFPGGNCSHQFKERNNVDTHTTVHQKAVSHRCTYCIKDCKTRQRLMEHIQSIHVETPLAQAAKGGGSSPAADGKESYDKASPSPGGSSPAQVSSAGARGSGPARVTSAGTRESRPGQVEDPSIRNFQSKSWLTRLTKLRKHTLRMHKGVNLHSCLECDKRFRLGNNLKKHTLSMHKRAKPCPCKICGNKFLLNQGLKKHTLSMHK